MDKEKLNEILNTAITISDIARSIFGNANYTNRNKSKKILEDNSINWVEWIESKKKKPNHCLYCGKEFNGNDKYRRKFCNNSCAASFNNRQRLLKNEKRYCLNCGAEINKRNKYCSIDCKTQYEEQQLITKWKSGNDNGCCVDGSIKNFVRNYLLRKNDYKCEECGFDKINQYTNNSILQIHHIDGNAFNNKEENLKVLCPNCHALTENYGSRNKNSTRIDRRTKYFKGNT